MTPHWAASSLHSGPAQCLCRAWTTSLWDKTFWTATTVWTASVLAMILWNTTVAGQLRIFPVPVVCITIASALWFGIVDLKSLERKLSTEQHQLNDRSGRLEGEITESLQLLERDVVQQNQALHHLIETTLPNLRASALDLPPLYDPNLDTLSETSSNSGSHTPSSLYLNEVLGENSTIQTGSASQSGSDFSSLLNNLHGGSRTNIRDPAASEVDEAEAADGFEQ
ncbi:hypothetical protein DACRYDRAFT_106993 [Dacryopinax primogenitus]|uniref:Uncharacterized protein n=1 Tax=Dacryopinax primogenitus (strain DJM 731) TaxID=1858805 RepID=M5FXY3_DACPD|nr:uncharacterized protein DACRYDRAFT_106993 [Dacryopinax primogenitus]EJU02911.1 hypothetical protein DACRYDRAFT_106993 [Dacryopinax primogenitus]